MTASEAGQAGTVCLVLSCTSSTQADAVAAARRWCADRALSAETAADAVRLVEEAVVHGLRFEPRDLVMSMRWADLDRMRVDLTWQGCATQAVAMDVPAAECLHRANAVFDVVADTWGLGTTEDGESWHWFTVDTRRANGSVADGARGLVRPATAGRRHRQGSVEQGRVVGVGSTNGAELRYFDGSMDA